MEDGPIAEATVPASLVPASKQDRQEPPSSTMISRGRRHAATRNRYRDDEDDNDDMMYDMFRRGYPASFFNPYMQTWQLMQSAASGKSEDTEAKTRALLVNSNMTYHQHLMDESRKHMDKIMMSIIRQLSNLKSLLSKRVNRQYTRLFIEISGFDASSGYFEPAALSQLTDKFLDKNWNNAEDPPEGDIELFVTLLAMKQNLDHYNQCKNGSFMKELLDGAVRIASGLGGQK